MTTLIFRDPKTGNRERLNPFFAHVQSLLLGPVYFGIHGVWNHVVLWFLAAMFSLGAAWVVYPFFAARIMRRHYLDQGWDIVQETGGQTTTQSHGSSAHGAPPRTQEVKLKPNALQHQSRQSGARQQDSAPGDGGAHQLQSQGPRHKQSESL